MYKHCLRKYHKTTQFKIYILQFYIVSLQDNPKNAIDCSYFLNRCFSTTVGNQLLLLWSIFKILIFFSKISILIGVKII